MTCMSNFVILCHANRTGNPKRPLLTPHAKMQREVKDLSSAKPKASQVGVGEKPKLIFHHVQQMESAHYPV